MYHQIGARYNVPMPTSEVISHKDEHADLLLDALASSIVLGYCTSESFRNVFRQDYDSDPLEFLMNEGRIEELGRLSMRDIIVLRDRLVAKDMNSDAAVDAIIGVGKGFGADVAAWLFANVEGDYADERREQLVMDSNFDPSLVTPRSIRLDDRAYVLLRLLRSPKTPKETKERILELERSHVRPRTTVLKAAEEVLGEPIDVDL